jgi:3-hydroxybutyryl-CoA dehydrogenase
MVAGSGFMGSGIAQVAAAAGFTVVMQYIKDEPVQKGMAIIEKNLKNGVAKGKLSEEDMRATVGRITPTFDLSLAKDCDAVIEVIFENKQAKTELFKKLDELCPPQVIFASNTSSIPITELAAATKRLHLGYIQPVSKGNLIPMRSANPRMTVI